MLTMMVLAALTAPPEYLTTVVSEPVVTTGTPAEIASRGEVCMAQALGSGRAGGELIVSRDIPAGVVVSRNALTYMDGLLRWEIRSRVTLEARQDRFRITHANIERNNDQGGGWSPVGKWWGSGWQKAENALKGQSADLAACISATPSREEW